MSNEYYKKLFDDLDQISTQPRGVGITTVAQAQPQEQQGKMTAEQIKSIHGPEVGSWILEHANVALAGVLSVGIAIKVIGWIYSIGMKLGGRPFLNYIAKPLFNFIRAQGPRGIAKLAEIMTRTSSLAARAAVTAPAALGEVVLDIGVPAAIAPTATTALAAALPFGAASLGALIGWILIALAVGIGLESIIAYAANKWLDRDDTQKQETLTSTTAYFIAQLFQRNKQSLSAEKSEQLVERYNELFKENLSSAPQLFPNTKGSQLVSAIRGKVMQQIAQENNLKYVAPTAKGQKPAPKAPASVPTQKAQPKAPAQKAKPKAAPVSQKPAFEAYKVQSGDSLSAIAAKAYGQGGGKLWPIIATANGITNPRAVPIGMTLKIPPKRALTAAEKELLRSEIANDYKKKKQKQQAPVKQEAPQAPAQPAARPIGDAAPSPTESVEARPSAQYNQRKHYLTDQKDAIKNDMKLLKKDPMNPVVSERIQGRLRQYEDQGDVQLYAQAVKQAPEETAQKMLDPHRFIKNFLKNRVTGYVRDYKTYYQQFFNDAKWLYDLKNTLDEKGIDNTEVEQTFKAMHLFRESGGKKTFKQAWQEAGE